ncbi:tyrosine-protein phosphatase non-receptor type 23b [Sardina pilchardus]|uniref:tyrosine-protein phosphatase non-receptor type 23b n=1 Tax=Sardina pilchardus TaxID=27697 RepID=UPI002E124CCF
MEAVPRMPMISLDLKKAGDFNISHSVREFIQSNYSESPEDYSEPLKRLEQLRQTAVNVPRDFEGCSLLRKYLGQLHFLQSRVPMAKGQQAAVPVAWTDVFSGKAVTHNDIRYEQACVLYNLGTLHSALGAMDNRVSEEGMKVSCTHFQCSAGAFAYLRDHYSHSFSSDMGSQTLTIYINLMLAQAQECLLEKSLLDNRKSFLIARICAQVVDYYKQCVKTLEAADSSVLGKREKEWRKHILMKISYFSAITQLHMGKQAEEQQKYGESVAYLQSALDKLNEAIKQSKGQPDIVQDALRFSMDVIGGKFNSAKKDNDFIYHETVPAMDTLATVKGASLVKALPVNPTDPSVTGPDLFSKLVPMAAHEASSLYSEEKAKLLREVMVKIESRNEALEQFMDSLSLECVLEVGVFGVLPETLMEKCAELSVKDNAVQSLVKAMQALAGVNADVEEKLSEVKVALEEEAAAERSLGEVLGEAPPPPTPAPLEEVKKELRRYEEAHATATHTNTELHTHMSQHLPNLRLLQGPLQQLRDSLPTPKLSEDDTAALQQLQRILGKVHEMRGQRLSLEQQLRDLIHKDDITGVLVTTERAQMKVVFEEQLQKYSQLQGYLEQNLSAQDNILRALTDANVHTASVRKHLQDTHTQWDSTIQGLLMSSEAYEELLRKAEEGRAFYQGLLGKCSTLLQRAKDESQEREQERLRLLDRAVGKAPPRPTAPKPLTDRGFSPSSLPNPRLTAGALPNPSLLPGGASGPVSWPPVVPPGQPFPSPAAMAQMPPHTRPTAPLHSHHQPPGAAPPGQPPNATQGPPFGYGPSPWQSAPGGAIPRHPMMPGGYMPPPHMGQNAPRPGQMPPPHLAPQYPSAHPQASPTPHMPLGPPLQQYMPSHPAGMPTAPLRGHFPGHPGHPGMPGQPPAQSHANPYQPAMPGQQQGPPGVPPHQGMHMAPNRVPAPGQAPGQMYPPQGQHGMGGYLPPSVQGYPQMPYGYPGAQPRVPAPAGGGGGGGVPVHGGMPSYSPQPHMQPQPQPQPHPNLMGAPLTPASTAMSNHAPPPHLQQPLVPQQVGVPSSWATAPTATGPPGSQGQGVAAAAVADIRAEQDPLQARLEQLSLQPPEGALPASASQPSQPINGQAHSLHQLEQKNGFVEPAPSETGSTEANGITKHSDLLSDLDPLWN